MGSGGTNSFPPRAQDRDVEGKKSNQQHRKHCWVLFMTKFSNKWLWMTRLFQRKTEKMMLAVGGLGT